MGMPDGVSYEVFARLYHLDTVDPNINCAKSTILSAKAEEKERSGSGRWREVLDVLGLQLVGRAEALHARKVVVKVREEADRSRTRIKAPKVYSGLVSSKGEDVLEDPKKAAEARRESSYRVLASVKKEWEVENEKVGVLGRRLKDLKREVDEKRKVLFLLEVLEKRAVVKMSRIGRNTMGKEQGIGDLLRDLRYVAYVCRSGLCG